MADPLYTERVAATFKNLGTKLYDNALNNVPLGAILKKKGNFKPVSGGLQMGEFIQYDGNGTYTRMNQYDQVNISPRKVFDRNEFTPYGVTVSVAAAWTELLENRGEEALIDLIMARKKGMETEFRNKMEIDLMGDGTLHKQFVGLTGLITTTPSLGVVGGIDASLWEFWRNSYFSGVTNGGAAVSATNIESYLDKIMISINRENDRIDHILMDDNYFSFLRNAHRARNNLVDDMANMKHQGVTVVHCGGIGGAIPSNTAILLNTDYIFLRSYTGKELENLGDREPTDQAATVTIYGWYGGMTISNRRQQARLGA